MSVSLVNRLVVLGIINDGIADKILVSYCNLYKIVNLPSAYSFLAAYFTLRICVKKSV